MSTNCRYYDFDKTDVVSVIAVEANYNYDIDKAMEIYVTQIGGYTFEELKDDVFLYPKEIKKEEAFARYIMAIYRMKEINIISVKDAVDVFESLIDIALTKEMQ